MFIIKNTAIQIWNNPSDYGDNYAIRDAAYKLRYHLPYYHVWEIKQMIWDALVEYHNGLIDARLEKVLG